MTDDIVKRLRYGLIDTNTSYRYLQEAADEIEKLRAENKKMREKVVSNEMDLTAVNHAGFARGKNYARAEIERRKVQIDNLTAENEKLRAAGEGVVKWWLDDGCLPFDGAPYALFALRKALGIAAPKPHLGESDG